MSRGTVAGRAADRPFDARSSLFHEGMTFQNCFANSCVSLPSRAAGKGYTEGQTCWFRAARALPVQA